MKKKLSKSNYLRGLECPKLVWNIFNHPEKIPPLTKVEQFKLNEGTKTGELAKQLYPDGIDIFTMNEAKFLELSREFLKKRKPLFEAGFTHNNCLSRVDILAPVEGGWELIEVKSGTKVKDVNLHDVAFQKYLYEANGLEIKGSYLMHLNKEYVRKGELVLEELFVKEDISEQVDELLETIEENITNIFKLIKQKEEPQPGIFLPKIIKYGNHNCLRDGCIDISENSVFNLYRGKKLASELFLEGIETLGDIPEDCVLKEKQTIQKECEQQKKIHVNKKLISEFLVQLQYPLYYLDFETIATSIPMFDGLRPHAQVPFQYSLHVVRKEGAEPEHYEFLYDGCEDPRKEFIEFIEELQKVLGEIGSIVVYNQSFEIKRLEELAAFLPEYEEWVEQTKTRIIDLLTPFRGFYYYNPKQKGSASIKRVLPAITGKSYDDLDIAEGMTASIGKVMMIWILQKG
ncbi:MAG: DUF2779 domain-containing protein [Candidatus Heimdallarchaeota archaeon]